MFVCRILPKFAQMSAKKNKITSFSNYYNKMKVPEIMLLCACD